LLFPAVGAHRGWSDRFVIAEIRDQVLEKRIALVVLGAPTGHLVELSYPPGAGETLRMNQAQAVAGEANALLLLLPLLGRGLIRRQRCAEHSGEYDDRVSHYAFSTVTPTRSIPFHR